MTEQTKPTPSAGERPCTCHPDDNPPRPCPQKFAYSECVKAGAGGDSGERRFFVEHGALHDRKTGQHWHEREGYPAAEDCEALNAIEALPGGVSERYLRRCYMDDAEFGQLMLREAAEKDAQARAALQAPCAECGFTGDHNLPTTVDALELENVRLSEERDHLLKWLETGLTFGKNKRAGDDRGHMEWHAKCGCAYHPEPFPHVHPCGDGHKRPDLHAAPQSGQAPQAAAPGHTDLMVTPESIPADLGKGDPLVDRDARFLRHCVSVMRGVIHHCQPKPQTAYDDPTEYYGGIALEELGKCADALDAPQAAVVPAPQSGGKDADALLREALDRLTARHDQNDGSRHLGCGDCEFIARLRTYLGKSKTGEGGK